MTPPKYQGLQLKREQRQKRIDFAEWIAAEMQLNHVTPTDLESMVDEYDEIQVR